MANLDIFEREGLNDHVKQNAPAFRATLEKLLDLPIVGDVRGARLLLRHRAGQGQGDPGDVRRRRVASGCCAATCPGALFDAGLYCRADDRGDPVIQLAPPLIIGQPEFDDIEQRLRSVLTGAPASTSDPHALMCVRPGGAGRMGP